MSSAVSRSAGNGAEVRADNVLEKLLPLLQGKLKIKVAFEKNIEDLFVLGRGCVIFTIFLPAHGKVTVLPFYKT
jgi:hypothetical protein